MSVCVLFVSLIILLSNKNVASSANVARQIYCVIAIFHKKKLFKTQTLKTNKLRIHCIVFPVKFEKLLMCHHFLFVLQTDRQ